MDERQIGLALALKEIGISNTVSDFDSRLILQKSVYLLEEAGVRLGYSFNWYLRGPYSPALTRDLFELSSNSEDVAGWVLDSQSLSTARQIKSLFESAPSESQYAKARRLELAASLHYLSRRRGVDIDNYENAKEQLEKNGKLFSLDDATNAVQELKRVRLL